MATFYRGNGLVALTSGQVAQFRPERWLSITGTVAHFSPDYPVGLIGSIDIIILPKHWVRLFIMLIVVSRNKKDSK